MGILTHLPAEDAWFARRARDHPVPSVSDTGTVPVRTREDIMDTTIETVIIGAGQAGLSTGYHLQRQDRPFVILDGAGRVGDQWRQQWDTLRLYSPAKYDGLPGLPFPGEPWSFPGKDQVADYLEQYANHFNLPIRFRTRVERLDGDGNGNYVVTTKQGSFRCRNVVVCTGTFGRTPSIPEFAADLDPSILQLHSSEYRRPAQLREGPVLVVGGSHSGTDIAYEAAQTHPTILAGRDCGQIPVRIESRPARVVFPVLVFAWKHVITRRTPIGRKEMQAIRFHGGPMLRVKRSDLASRGVERITERVTGVADGRPVIGGTAYDVANVVWATGFRQVFDWIRLPVIGDDGWPVEYRGVVTDSPGLFFCGLSFQFGFSSMVLPGIGRDAAFVADRIADRVRRTGPAKQPTAA
jgi:putative flavoprotein involved in K+ transport